MSDEDLRRGVRALKSAPLDVIDDETIHALADRLRVESFKRRGFALLKRDESRSRYRVVVSEDWVATHVAVSAPFAPEHAQDGPIEFDPTPPQGGPRDRSLEPFGP